MYNSQLFFLITLFIFPAFAFSQPDITNAIYPVPGTSFELMSIQLSLTGDYTKSGENQTWDLSELTELNDTTRLAYLPVEETPYASLFPSATIAMTSNKTDYQYFKFDDKGYYQVGSYYIDTTIGIGIIFEQMNETYSYHFPIQYNTHSSLLFKSKITYPELIEIYDDHVIEQYVDGYGTLILGNDTIKNVLRVKEIGHQTATVKAIHPEAKEGEMTNEYVRYQWWSNKINAPILTIEDTLEEDGEIEEIEESKVTYTVSIKDYLKDSTLFPLQLLAFSNSKNEINISFNLEKDENAQLSVYDAMGKLVKSQSIGNNSKSEKHSTAIDLAGLSKGIYLIGVQTSNNRFESIRVYIQP